MREILFRAKAKEDGMWIEGFPIRIYDYGGLVWDMHPFNTNFEITRSVDPKTICQFTGLTDKNGKKIFEGDVVNAVIVRDLGGGTENRQETGIIAYDKIGMIGLVAKYAGTIPVWSDFFQELTLSGCINDFWFEIIGNIHDNPELLENP